jgi:hypothetical protein
MLIPQEAEVHRRHYNGHFGKEDPRGGAVVSVSDLKFRVFADLNSTWVKHAVKATRFDFGYKRLAGPSVNMVLSIALGMPFRLLEHFFVGEVLPLAHEFGFIG